MNQTVLTSVSAAHVEVGICRVDELERHRGLRSELDDMWSSVGKKAHQRWLWHAIDHHTGEVLADVFGRRTDDVFLRLKALLAPCGITRYDTDGWGPYERYVDAEHHTVGKEHMQRIENTHLTLRTRIKRLMRRTICLSKTECITWSPDCSSTGMSLSTPFNRGSTTLKYLPHAPHRGTRRAAAHGRVSPGRCREGFLG